MSPPHASAGSGHGWTPIPRLSPPSLGFIPGLTMSLGPPWGCSGAGAGSPIALTPHCTPTLPVGRQLPPSSAVPTVGSLSQLTLPLITLTLPATPAELPGECRGERHFGLRKDTRRLACLLLRLILDSICSLLCGALAGCQPGELKAPAQSSLSPAAGKRRRRQRVLGGESGDPQGRLVPSLPAGMLQHPRASRAAGRCCRIIIRLVWA